MIDRSRAGLMSLLLSNVFACLSLIWLSSASHGVVENILLLGSGNLVVGILIIVWCRRSEPSSVGFPLVTLPTLLWSGGYALTYSIFLAFPNSVSLTTLTCLRMLVPIFSLFASGDWRKEPSLGVAIGKLSPIGALVFILVFQTGDTQFSEVFSSLNIEIWGAILLASTVSQVGARLESRNYSGQRENLQAVGTAAIWNGLLVMTLGFFVTEVAGTDLNLEKMGWQFVFQIAIAASFIVVTMASYLRGLAHTPPSLSALALSTIIPISVLLDAIGGRLEQPIWSVGFSLFFLACVWWMQEIERRKTILLNKRHTA